MNTITSLIHEWQQAIPDVHPAWCPQCGDSGEVSWIEWETVGGKYQPVWHGDYCECAAGKAALRRAMSVDVNPDVAP